MVTLAWRVQNFAVFDWSDLNHSISIFDRILNSIGIPLVGRAPGITLHYRIEWPRQAAEYPIEYR